MIQRDTNEQKLASQQDHESDPARTPGDGWVDEGGASHLGPATHLDAARVANEHQSTVQHGDSESTE